MKNEITMTPDTTGATGGEKFTPGPWRFITVVTSIGHCHKINPMNACIYVDHRGKDDRDEKTATALANARLISAAPELYAALAGWKKLHADMIALGGDVKALTNEQIANFAVEQANLIRITDSALAKAKGDQGD